MQIMVPYSQDNVVVYYKDMENFDPSLEHGEGAYEFRMMYMVFCINATFPVKCLVGILINLCSEALEAKPCC